MTANLDKTLNRCIERSKKAPIPFLEFILRELINILDSV